MTAPDPLHNCPFDKAHRIQASRLQYHLVRCKQNYPFNAKVYCPFNYLHILDKQKYEHHIQTCPSSGNVKIYKYSLEPVEKIESVPLQNLQKIVVPSTSTEDWDGNCATYNPLHDIENKNIVRPMIAVSKSKKKEFKKQERLRLSSLDENCKSRSPIKFDAWDKLQLLENPLRTPRQPARAALFSAGGGEDQTANKNIFDSRLRVRCLSNEDANLQLCKSSLQVPPRTASDIEKIPKEYDSDDYCDKETKDEDEKNVAEVQKGLRNEDSVFIDQNVVFNDCNPNKGDKLIAELSECMKFTKISVKDEFKNEWITPSRKRTAGRGLAVACTVKPTRAGYR